MGNPILIVEDDVRLMGLLEEALGDLGFPIEGASDGVIALEKVAAGEYSLIVLDIGLPRLNGIEVCRQIRADNRSVPILMLTSRSEEIDKVLGLELGADDYVTKPFSVRELTARSKALLRRAQLHAAVVGERGPAEIVIGDIAIHTVRRTVTSHGRPVDLTASEYDILLCLASQPGRAFSRDELMNNVLGYQSTCYEATVTSHLSRLRAKLEADRDNPRYILTVKGVGYRFVAPDELTKSG